MPQAVGGSRPAFGVEPEILLIQNRLEKLALPFRKNEVCRLRQAPFFGPFLMIFGSFPSVRASACVSLARGGGVWPLVSRTGARRRSCDVCRRFPFTRLLTSVRGAAHVAVSLIAPRALSFQKVAMTDRVFERIHKWRRVTMWMRTKLPV